MSFCLGCWEYLPDVGWDQRSHCIIMKAEIADQCTWSDAVRRR